MGNLVDSQLVCPVKNYKRFNEPIISMLLIANNRFYEQTTFLSSFVRSVVCIHNGQKVYGKYSEFEENSNLSKVKIWKKHNLKVK